MKKLNVFLVIILVGTSVAQNKITSSPIKREIGGAVAPVIKYSTIDEQSQILFGARLNYIFNQSITLGGAVYGLVSDASSNSTNNSSASTNTQLIYGGIEIGYLVLPIGNYNIYLNTLLGLGRIGFYDIDPNSKNSQSDSYYKKAFAVAEPTASFVVQLVSHISFEIGVGYRFTTSIEKDLTYDKSISGLIGIMAFNVEIY